MGLFKAAEPTATWSERATQVPADQGTWIVSLGGVGVNAVKDAGKVDAVVAEVEGCGWRLDQLVPAVTGTHMGSSGNTGTTLVGVFRRA